MLFLVCDSCEDPTVKPGSPTGQWWRKARRERRLRSFLCRERMAVAMALAERIHTSPRSRQKRQRKWLSSMEFKGDRGKPLSRWTRRWVRQTARRAGLVRWSSSRSPTLLLRFLGQLPRRFFVVVVGVVTVWEDTLVEFMSELRTIFLVPQLAAQLVVVPHTQGRGGSSILNFRKRLSFICQCASCLEHVPVDTEEETRCPILRFEFPSESGVLPFSSRNSGVRERLLGNPKLSGLAQHLTGACIFTCRCLHCLDHQQHTHMSTLSETTTTTKNFVQTVCPCPMVTRACRNLGGCPMAERASDVVKHSSSCWRHER